jgi:hypothetical protein
VWKSDSCSGGEEAECISYDKLLCLVANINAANSGGLQLLSCRKGMQCACAQVGGYVEPKPIPYPLFVYLFIHSFHFSFLPSLLLYACFFPLCSVVVSSFISFFLAVFFLLPSFLYFLLCGSISFSCRLFLDCFFKGFFLLSRPPFFLRLSFGSFLYPASFASFFLSLSSLFYCFISFIIYFVFNSLFRFFMFCFCPPSFIFFLQFLCLFLCSSPPVLSLAFLLLFSFLHSFNLCQSFPFLLPSVSPLSASSLVSPSLACFFFCFLYIPLLHFFHSRFSFFLNSFICFSPSIFLPSCASFYFILPSLIASFIFVSFSFFYSFLNFFFPSMLLPLFAYFSSFCFPLLLYFLHSFIRFSFLFYSFPILYFL